MSISLHVRRLGRTIQRLEAKAARLRNFRPLHNKAATVIFAWIQKNFELEGRLASPEGWLPLHPSTIARRRSGRGRGNPQILQDTGALKSRWDVLADTHRGLVRSRTPYAADHEYGRGGKPPQRRILPTKRQAEDLIRPIFKHHVSVSVR